MQSSLLRDHDMAQPKVEAQDSISGLSSAEVQNVKLDASSFDSRSCKLSLGKETRDQYVNGPKDWPQISSARYMNKVG